MANSLDFVHTTNFWVQTLVVFNIKCYWKYLDFAFSALVFHCHVGFNRLRNLYYCYTLTEVWNVYYLEIAIDWICGGTKISNVYLGTCLSHHRLLDCVWQGANPLSFLCDFCFQWKGCFSNAIRLTLRHSTTRGNVPSAWTDV